MAFNLWIPRLNEEADGSHPGIFRASGRKSKGNSPQSPSKVLSSPVASPVAPAPTSKCFPDADMESISGWLSSGMLYPQTQAGNGYPASSRGYHSVPVPSYYELKPACKESSASPLLSDSTASPVWSARSAETPSSRESTPTAKRRVPVRIHGGQNDGACSSSDSSDAESLAPRSSRTSSFDGDHDGTPRFNGDAVRGQASIPLTFPAPDAVPWAEDRLYISQKSSRTDYAEHAFAGLFSDAPQDHVPGSVFAISAPRLPSRRGECVLWASEGTQGRRWSEPVGTAHCDEQMELPSEFEAQANGKLNSDSEDTTAFQSLSSDPEALPMGIFMPTSSDSENDQAHAHKMEKHEMDGELRSIEDEMLDLVKSLSPDSATYLRMPVTMPVTCDLCPFPISFQDSAVDKAREHATNARDMKGQLDDELRSIDDEMQDLMRDLLRLKDHVTAAKTRMIGN